MSLGSHPGKETVVLCVLEPEHTFRTQMIAVQCMYTKMFCSLTPTTVGERISSAFCKSVTNWGLSSTQAGDCCLAQFSVAVFGRDTSLGVFSVLVTLLA